MAALGEHIDEVEEGAIKAHRHVVGSSTDVGMTPSPADNGAPADWCRRVCVGAALRRTAQESMPEEHGDSDVAFDPIRENGSLAAAGVGRASISALLTSRPDINKVSS